MTADHGQHGHPQEHGHPQPAEYVKIAVVLTIITGFEVSLFYLGERIGEGVASTAILILSALKFALVVLWYMHLKFDHKLFSYLMVGGLLLGGAVVLSLIALLPIIHITSPL